ncbi:MAG: hypothetical protein DWQ44_08160 [Bacteroidetes bacterium]|nr:MAG: hypothetical protein DWQ33_01560 [Bacteroidota bacterium]REK07043.1 MAG: hypothetical protein DWQ39_02530 [Bacteroidota bacterium]REK33610.1 MAG: hypothetical protein DWQ44_08160 [Bacteroidota bacterium]REK48595.1 MAG: hypothetical protein DWQ48_09595 [Bacteroidota bacterium]
MIVSKKIRSKFGQLKVLKEIQKLDVHREVVSFQDAEKIGILYDAGDIQDYEAVKNYVKTLRSQYKKDVLALGYFDKKVLPPELFAQYGLDFFTRKDLDFRMIPNDPIVSNFIENRFDILVNLDSGKCFPLRYIATVSRSRFRIGRYDKKYLSSYDMLLDIRDNPDIKTIIEEMHKFLQQIKP